MDVWLYLPGVWLAMARLLTLARNARRSADIHQDEVDRDEYANAYPEHNAWRELDIGREYYRGWRSLR